ncbi:MAG: recombinase family protein [Pseudomonadota bacterium]
MTGERIRDKIAASKKKGMWMGGGVPLGYDPPEPGSRRLRVNEAEAETVRAIFTDYLALGSVHALVRRLKSDVVLSKRRTTRAGKTIGGLPFSRGALFHLLRNRLNLGKIPHKEESYPGQHDPIIDHDLFNAVQERLNTQTRRNDMPGDPKARSSLAGRIFDVDGDRMSPTFAYGRSGKLYRYYVSAPLQQGRRCATDDDAPRRVSAPDLEDRLTAALNRLLPHPSEDPLALIARVDILPDQVMLCLPINLRARIEPHLEAGESLCPDPTTPGQIRLSLPIRLQSRSRKTDMVGGIKPLTRPDPVLIRALRAAHAMLEKDRGGAPILFAAPDTPHKRRLIRLAFLAPDIQCAILTGRQPKDISLARLLECDMPLAWSEQRRAFGIQIQD